MRRIGMLLLPSVVALGVSMVIVSPASAGWFVGGTELGVGKSAAAAEVSDFEGGVVSIAAGIVTACEGSDSIVNGRIIAPDLQYVQSVKLLQCHTITPTACQLEGGMTTIETQPVLALATLKRLRIKPATGNLYTTVFYPEESTCVIVGAQPVRGSAIAGMPNMETELVGQTIEGLGSLENNSLELGTGNKMLVIGKVLGLLANHSKWSFK